MVNVNADDDEEDAKGYYCFFCCSICQIYTIFTKNIFTKFLLLFILSLNFSCFHFLEFSLLTSNLCLGQTKPHLLVNRSILFEWFSYEIVCLVIMIANYMILIFSFWFQKHFIWVFSFISWILMKNYDSFRWEIKTPRRKFQSHSENLLIESPEQLNLYLILDQILVYLWSLLL